MPIINIKDRSTKYWEQYGVGLRVVFPKKRESSKIGEQDKVYIYIRDKLVTPYSSLFGAGNCPNGIVSIFSIGSEMCLSPKPMPEAVNITMDHSDGVDFPRRLRVTKNKVRALGFLMPNSLEEEAALTEKEFDKQEELLTFTWPWGRRDIPVYRFERIDDTTPSGKQLYRCTGCGVQDPAPTKFHDCVRILSNRVLLLKAELRKWEDDEYRQQEMVQFGELRGKVKRFFKIIDLIEEANQLSRDNPDNMPHYGYDRMWDHLKDQAKELFDGHF